MFLRALLFLFCLTPLAQAERLVSVYDSASMMKLVEHWESEWSEFYFYEAMDQMSQDHGLECRAAERTEIREMLAPFNPQGKENVFALAMSDLDKALGEKDLEICAQVFEDGAEMVFQTRDNQIILLFTN